MPLYRNGEVFITDANRKEIQALINAKIGHKWPIKISIPKEHIKYDEVNKRKTQPAMLRVPMSCVSVSDGISETWKYSQTAIPKDEVLTKYVEGLISTHSYFVQPNQLELAYYILFIYPFHKGHPMFAKIQGARAVYEIEDREAQSKLRNDKQRLRNAVGYFIDTVFNNFQVRMMGSALGMTLIWDEKIGNEEAVNLVINHIETGNLYDKFKELKSIPEEINIRAVLQKLVDTAVLAYDTTTGWVRVQNGERVKTFCGIIGPRSAYDSLVFHMAQPQNSQDFSELKALAQWETDFGTVRDISEPPKDLNKEVAKEATVNELAHTISESSTTNGDVVFEDKTELVEESTPPKRQWSGGRPKKPKTE